MGRDSSGRFTSVLAYSSDGRLRSERKQVLDREGRVLSESYRYIYSDIPDQARSYPNPPPGYGGVSITLTVDENG